MPLSRLVCAFSQSCESPSAHAQQGRREAGFTCLEVLQRDLSHEVIVGLKLLIRPQMIVIELHTADTRIAGRTGPETRHTSAVEVQRATGEEIEEQAILLAHLAGICHVLREVGVVGHGVEGRRVDFGEAGMRPLAVQAFLEAIDHGLPVEASGVADAAAVGQSGKIDACEEGCQTLIELFKAWCFV